MGYYDLEQIPKRPLRGARARREGIDRWLILQGDSQILHLVDMNWVWVEGGGESAFHELRSSPDESEPDNPPPGLLLPPAGFASLLALTH